MAWFRGGALHLRASLLPMVFLFPAAASALPPLEAPEPGEAGPAGVVSATDRTPRAPIRGAGSTAASGDLFDPVWEAASTLLSYDSAWGDVDGDGYPDLVLGNSTGIYVYLNRDGSLAEPPQTLAALRVQAVALGDLDGDGDADLVCGRRSLENLAFFNQGGVFGPAPAWSSSDSLGASDVVLGDVDGDGDLDLVFSALSTAWTSGTSGPKRLYRNDGGVITSTPVWESQGFEDTEELALGDADGDGRLDLVCANFAARPARDLAFGNMLDGLGDFNGDGIDDIVVVSRTPDQKPLAYLFWGGASPDASADLEIRGGNVIPVFNWKAKPAGDVNGDGFSDLGIGDPTYGGGAGRVAVLFGGSSPDTIPDWVLVGQPSEALGADLVAPGDLNGDGFADLVVVKSGGCNVYFGGSPPDTTVDLVLPYAQFRTAAGDVNGDGYPDLLFGSLGVAALYFGGPGMDDVPDWEVNGQIFFGSNMAGIGDLNGDGYDDVAVATRATPFLNGTVDVFFGGPVMDTESDLTFLYPLNVSPTVGGPGDLDGDGFADLAVGFPTLSIDKVEIYFGGAAPDTSADLELHEIGGYSGFGSAIARSVDFNGDGLKDLVVSAPNADLAGVSAGTVHVYFGASPMDGDLDLLLAGVDGALVQGGGFSVYLNQGGTFPPGPSWKPDDSEFGFNLSLGDVDGDGDLDAVIGHLAGANLYEFGHRALFRNDGGVLLPVWKATVPTYNRGVDLADVDLDGDLDLTAVNQLDDLEVFINQTGSFNENADFRMPVQSEETGAALADVDGDGDLDLATTSTFNSPNRVFRNRQGGWFSNSLDLPVWGSNQDVALGDIDQDGDQDLIFAGSYWSLGYLNDGGTLPTQPSWTVNMDAGSVALGDLDGDGALEVVFGTSAYDSTQLPAVLYELVAGRPGGLPIWTSTEARATNGVTLADMNDDGWLDLVSSNNGRLSIYDCASPGEANTIHYWDPGVGRLAPAAAWTSVDAAHSGKGKVVDVNLDGVPDLVVPNHCGSEPCVLYRGTQDSLRASPSALLASGNVDNLAVGDVNGDGAPDVVISKRSGADLLLINDGDGNFVQDPWAGYAGSTGDVLLDDVDGDGDLDLLEGRGSTTCVLLMNEGGVLSSIPSWYSDQALGTKRVALRDLDMDGDLDAVLVSGGGLSFINYGLRNPAYRWNAAEPTDQLPDNPTVLRKVTVLPEGGTTYRIHIEASDVEGDPFWLFCEYRLQAESAWHPLQIDGATRLGPLTASPQGTVHEFLWDASPLPITLDPVRLRFRFLSVPRRVTTGPVLPGVYQYQLDTLVRRPRVQPAVSPIVFPTVTLGDTVTAQLAVVNEGNMRLSVSSVSSATEGLFPAEAFPVNVPAKSTREVPVLLAPRALLPSSVSIQAQTNDPLNPIAVYSAVLDVRDIAVEVHDLVASDMAPLGEAFPVVVSPDPGVHIESGAIYYRASTSGAFRDSLRLVRIREELLGTLPAEAMVEVGVDYYVAVENSGIRRVFPPGAPDAFFHKDVESPRALSAIAQTNLGSDYVRGLEVRVQVDLDQGAIFGSGTLHYRQGGETVPYRSRAIEATVPLPSAVIPDTVVGDRGVEFWVEVTTAGGTPLQDPPVDPALHPLAFSTTIPRLEEPSEHPGGRYRMVSFPLRFRQDFQGTLAALLSDQPEFGPYDVKRWRAFRYLSTEGRYVELSEEGQESRFQPKPGRAFWLVSREPHRVDTAPITGLSTPTDSSFSLVLAPGWNQVGDPFAFPVSWSEMSVEGTPTGSQATVEPPVGWDVGSGSYVLDEEVLVPFEGYWVKNGGSGPVRLEIPAQEAAVPAAAPRETSATVSGWAIRLEVRSQGIVDRGNRVGVAGSASESWDGQDRSDPPLAPERGLSLYVPHGDWETRPGVYAVDLRGPGGADFQGAVWRLDVAKGFSEAESGDEVVLTADTQEVPEGFQVQLVDRVLGRATAFGHGASYTYLSGAHGVDADPEAARFELVVGTEAFLRDRDANGSGAEFRTRLLQNFPNPFRSGTRIRYEIQEAGSVRIEVFDIRGRLVRGLTVQAPAAGRYEVAWDGRDETGQAAGPGVYFYRLTGPGKTDTRRMLKIG